MKPIAHDPCDPHDRLERVVVMQYAPSFESIRELLTSALERIASASLLYAPRLLAGLALFLLGWGIARATAAFVGLVLRRIGFDRLCAQMRVSQALNRIGLTRPPSRLSQRALFWAIWFVFAIAALDALELSDLPLTLQKVFAYLPSVLAAAFILGVGILSGRFARNLLASAARIGALEHGQRLGAIAERLVIGLFLIVAAQQLGLKTDLIVAVVATTVGTLALAFSIAFALGASPVIRHILAGHFLRKSLTVGGSITIQGRRGQIERVGPIDTLLRTDDEMWSIPNARLIDEVLIR